VLQRVLDEVPNASGHAELSDSSVWQA
jgi:hypothetical protein